MSTDLTMEPLYKPEGVEARWQGAWETEGLYAAGAGRPARRATSSACRLRTSPAIFISGTR